MADTSQSRWTICLEDCLERLHAGDPLALDGLIRHACQRLEWLTQRMLEGFPRVQRWVEADDVMQNALVRLMRALRDVQPTSSRQFFALATLQIRRELIDLTRHFLGPMGVGGNYVSPPPNRSDWHHAQPDVVDDTNEPTRLAEWQEFHQHAADLPGQEQEVFGLLYYPGLTQNEAAGLLGVSTRTVQRRWNAAMLTLHPLLGGGDPQSPL